MNPLQRHDWEHPILDDLDYQRHVDYVHVHPLKLGLIKRVIDWPYSTFHQSLAQIRNSEPAHVFSVAPFFFNSSCMTDNILLRDGIRVVLF